MRTHSLSWIWEKYKPLNCFNVSITNYPVVIFPHVDLNLMVTSADRSNLLFENNKEKRNIFIIGKHLFSSLTQHVLLLWSFLWYNLFSFVYLKHHAKKISTWNTVIIRVWRENENNGYIVTVAVFKSCTSRFLRELMKLAVGNVNLWSLINSDLRPYICFSRFKITFPQINIFRKSSFQYAYFFFVFFFCEIALKTIWTS